MRFQIEPTPDENQRACTAIVAAALPPSRANLIAMVLYAAVVGAAYVFTPQTVLPTALIGIAAAVATGIALQAEGQWRFRRLQANDPHSQETHYVELSSEGLHTWCGHADVRYPWRDIAKVTENREFYLFVGRSGSGSAIPKRLLDDTAEIELRQSIRQWAPDAAMSLARETA